MSTKAIERNRVLAQRIREAPLPPRIPLITIDDGHIFRLRDVQIDVDPTALPNWFHKPWTPADGLASARCDAEWIARDAALRPVEVTLTWMEYAPREGLRGREIVPFATRSETVRPQLVRRDRRAIAILTRDGAAPSEEDLNLAWDLAEE